MVENLISVIVPVYNVKDYLEECVASILQQTYPNFELLLIDDGSTDGSGSLCDQLALKDERIRIVHKKNGGLADARNVGLDEANGNRIAFVDSDDTIRPQYLEVLNTLMSQQKADIVQVGIFTNVDEKKSPKGSETEVFSGEKALENLLRFKIVKVYAHSKLYSRELFGNIRYPYGKLMEDSFTTYKLIAKATKVVCESRELYFYRQRKGSIMNSDFTERKAELLDVPNQIKNFLLEKGYSIPDESIDYYQMRLNVNLYKQSVASRNNYDNFNVKLRSKIRSNLKIQKRMTMELKYRVLTILIRNFPKVVDVIFKF